MTLQFIYVLEQEPEEAPNILNKKKSLNPDVLLDFTSSSVAAIAEPPGPFF